MNSLPGTGLLGSGYDIFGDYMRPEASKRSRIFKLGGFNDGRQFGNYRVPDNVDTASREESRGVSYVFSTREKLSESFSQAAALSGSYKGFSGSVEANYRDTSERDNQYWYAGYSMRHTAFTALLGRTAFELLYGEVKSAIEALPVSYDPASPSASFNFFDQFGTHFVSAVVVGGRLDYSVSVRKSYTKESSQVSAKVEAEYRAVYSAKASSDTQWSQLGKQWEQNRSVSVSALGGATSVLKLTIPPAKGENREDGLNSWIETLDDNLAVTDISLTSISDICPPPQKATLEAAFGDYLLSRHGIQASFSPAGGYVVSMPQAEFEDLHDDRARGYLTVLRRDTLERVTHSAFQTQDELFDAMNQLSEDNLFVVALKEAPAKGKLEACLGVQKLSRLKEMQQKIDQVDKLNTRERASWEELTRFTSSGYLCIAAPEVSAAYEACTWVEGKGWDLPHVKTATVKAALNGTDGSYTLARLS